MFRLVFSLFVILSLIMLAGLAFYALNHDEALAAPTKIQNVNKIIVKKGERTLSLYRDDEEIKSYKIALGFNPTGHKQQEGDGRTPEGLYAIDLHNPNSRYHLSLRISYPNAQDKVAAAAQGASPGGDIFIHGQPDGFVWSGAAQALFDWTAGCIAVNNQEIEEIYAAAGLGTPIEIRP